MFGVPMNAALAVVQLTQAHRQRNTESYCRRHYLINDYIPLICENCVKI
jgi:hypothetical protein